MTSTSNNNSGESRWLFRLMTIGWAVVVAVLLINIISAPSDIGSPANESQAVIRANERLLELVKWTISTILLVGGGLIGLNWYQSTQRYERDKDDIESRIRKLEQIEDRVRGYLDDVSLAKRDLENRFQAFDPDLTGNKPSNAPMIDKTDSAERRGAVQSFFENIYSRESLPPFQKHVERYLSPNPFRSIEEQKQESVDAILTMLKEAQDQNLIGEALTQQGITHLKRLLPVLSVENPTVGNKIRLLLKELGFGPIADVPDNRG